MTSLFVYISRNCGTQTLIYSMSYVNLPVFVASMFQVGAICSSIQCCTNLMSNPVWSSILQEGFICCDKNVEIKHEIQPLIIGQGKLLKLFCFLMSWVSALAKEYKSTKNLHVERLFYISFCPSFNYFYFEWLKINTNKGCHTNLLWLVKRLTNILSTPPPQWTRQVKSSGKKFKMLPPPPPFHFLYVFLLLSLSIQFLSVFSC